ncbi:MAG: GtrA family protein [Candidatus Hodarchaeota archaeon]
MDNDSDKETKTEIFSQFIVYSLFAVITTIINLGGQVLFTNILLLNYILGAIIALAMGYTTKFFLDCFITFKSQRKEEVDIRKHYLVYMMTAIIFYLLNLVIQIYICTPLVESLVSDPLLITLISAGAAVAIVFLIKFPFDKYIIFKLLPEKMVK